MMENKDICKDCKHRSDVYWLCCDLLRRHARKTDECDKVQECDDYEPRPAESQK